MVFTIECSNRSNIKNFIKRPFNKNRSGSLIGRTLCYGHIHTGSSLVHFLRNKLQKVCILIADQQLEVRFFLIPKIIIKKI